MYVIITLVPSKDNCYRLACAPIKESDQSAHLRRLIRVFNGHSFLMAKGSMYHQAENEVSDQTAWIRRWI